MEKNDIVVTVPLSVLEDLVSMARRSPQYKDGHAWTALAMNLASRAINHALIRANTSTQQAASRRLVRRQL